MAFSTAANCPSIERRRYASAYWVAALISLSLLFCSPLRAAHLVDVRTGNWSDRLRLVFEVEQGIEVEQHYAERRLELHLPGLDRGRLQQLIDARQLRDQSLIREYRIESLQADDVVLVLELAEEVNPALMVLRPQSGHAHRFVLDLKFVKSPLVVSSRLAVPGPGTQPEAQLGSTPPPSPQAVALAASRVRSLRIGEWPDRTRLVIETDRAQPFALPANTGRQLDLRVEQIDAGSLQAALAAALSSQHRLIARGRAEAAGPGAAVLSLQLRSDTQVIGFNLLPEGRFGHRLVLDLLPAPERESVPVAAETARSSSVAVDQAPAALPNLLWLEASLNRQHERRTVLALQQQEHLLLAAADLQRWRLRLPTQADVVEDGEEWYRLDRLGIQHSLDRPLSVLDLNAPAALFEAAALSPQGRQRIPPMPSPLGGYLNYDLSVSEIDGQSSGAGFFELAAFRSALNATTTALWNRSSDSQKYRLLRLETALRHDDPEHMRSWVIGDSISRATGWSGAVRFAGLQWGRNFSTQPDYLTLPTVAVAGEAALPSIVELYVNDALRLRQDIPPGPFSIDQIPTITGQGDVRVVVRDALGREQVLTQEFYASAQLLRPGLHDWSVELGSVREDFGLQSSNYGATLASTTHRYGVADWMTAEAHAQWLKDQTMVGVGGVWRLPVSGVIQAATAVSESEQGRGQLFSLGGQLQGEWLSVGAESQWVSTEFRRTGMRADEALPSRQLRAYLSTRFGYGNSLGLSWTEQRIRQAQDIKFASVRFSRGLGQLGFFSLSTLYYPIDRELAVNLSLTFPIGHTGDRVSLNAARQNARDQGSVRWRRSLPAGTGYGYDLQTGFGESSAQRAAIAWQNDYGRWRVEGAYANASLAGRADAAGGIGMIEGHAFASRSIRDGFAVVRVPGRQGVRVYAENQTVATTNAEGVAIVPGLRAYQRNRVGIEQADLPLGMRVDQVEQLVVPYARAGVVLDFCPAHSRDAFFRVVLADGNVLPVGAALEWAGKRWPVGFRGEAYVTGLDAHSRLSAHYEGRTCEIELQVPDSVEPLLDLGTIVCHEVNQ
ncbi:fimbria/pilus outer membrane usher protein [Pseudomarimonas arenosa]|uniref:Fimbrial biogenesis outer membrane usher protein n=1 Tax=Pseudomarimonas arenosa TaxID=2774145 RepID=A0AAW3ZGG4_9GAMM|nr:fimbria/pilus outer membrane usher protein [Pseudomarimonas arenosa]MBD8524659.1 fimbrial biogenesis outer membrane usher protein [Pseudomarimonas arenosa]